MLACNDWSLIDRKLTRRGVGHSSVPSCEAYKKNKRCPRRLFNAGNSEGIHGTTRCCLWIKCCGLDLLIGKPAKNDTSYRASKCHISPREPESSPTEPALKPDIVPSPSTSCRYVSTKQQYSGELLRKESWRIPDAQIPLTELGVSLSLPQTALRQTDTRHTSAYVRNPNDIKSSTTFSKAVGVGTRGAGNRNPSNASTCAEVKRKLNISLPHTVVAVPARLLLPTWHGARGSGGRRSVAEESPPPPTRGNNEIAKQSLVTKSGGYADTHVRTTPAMFVFRSSVRCKSYL